MDVVRATTVLFLWNAIANFMPILGAFLSDSYLGRFRVIALGTIVTLIVSSLPLCPKILVMVFLFLLITNNHNRCSEY